MLGQRRVRFVNVVDRLQIHVLKHIDKNVVRILQRLGLASDDGEQRNQLWIRADASPFRQILVR